MQRRLVPFMSRFGMGISVSALAACSELARACSVCFGDPDSSMARGAVAGVWLMVAVVGIVLFGIAGTGVFWLHRSRRLGDVRRIPSDPAGSDA